jgi:hypothetical protein
MLLCYILFFAQEKFEKTQQDGKEACVFLVEQARYGVANATVTLPALLPKQNVHKATHIQTV